MHLSESALVSGWGLKAETGGFQRKLGERQIGESEYRQLSWRFVTKERRKKGQKLAKKVRSREYFSFFCINMVKITTRFYISSNDPGKRKLNETGDRGEKSWDCCWRGFDQVCMWRDGFRKEQSSQIGNGRKAGSMVQILVGSRCRAASQQKFLNDCFNFFFFSSELEARSSIEIEGGQGGV